MFPKTIDALNARITDLERGLRAAIHALAYAEEHFSDPAVAAAMWAHCDGGLIGAPDIRTLAEAPVFPFDFEQFCTLLKADTAFCDVEIQSASSDQDPHEVYFSLKDSDGLLYRTFSLYLDAVLNYDITLWSIGNTLMEDLYQESVSLRGLTLEDALRLLKTWIASITV